MGGRLIRGMIGDAGETFVTPEQCEHVEDAGRGGAPGHGGAQRLCRLAELEPGRFGVRIENTLLVTPYKETEFGRFLQFDALTLCPIDTRCLEPSLLTQEERDWFNDYHQQVRQRLRPLVEGAALAWLIERTEAI